MCLSATRCHGSGLVLVHAHPTGRCPLLHGGSSARAQQTGAEGSQGWTRRDACLQLLVAAQAPLKAGFTPAATAVGAAAAICLCLATVVVAAAAVAAAARCHHRGVRVRAVWLPDLSAPLPPRSPALLLLLLSLRSLEEALQLLLRSRRRLGLAPPREEHDCRGDAQRASERTVTRAPAPVNILIATPGSPLPAPPRQLISP
jgi:hypothetical protein